MAAFTVFIALYASHLGLGSVGLPFAIVAIVVLSVRTLAFPSLLTLAVHRAGKSRTSAIATFTGCFEIGLASAAIVLGVVLDQLGFAGLYGVAAGVSALALAPLAMTRAGQRAAAPAM
jgi:predicted MFS family arabinose efflux permease